MIITVLQELAFFFRIVTICLDFIQVIVIFSCYNMSGKNVSASLYDVMLKNKGQQQLIMHGF